MSENDLISKESLIKGLKLQKLKLSSLAPVIHKALKLEQVNQVYAHSASQSGLAFVDDVLNQLNIHYEFNEEDKKNIPMHEPIINLTNHPYGDKNNMIL